MLFDGGMVVCKTTQQGFRQWICHYARNTASKCRFFIGPYLTACALFCRTKNCLTSIECSSFFNDECEGLGFEGFSTLEEPGLGSK